MRIPHTGKLQKEFGENRAQTKRKRAVLIFFFFLQTIDVKQIEQGYEL